MAPTQATLLTPNPLQSPSVLDPKYLLSNMSTPGLAQIWSFDMGPAGETPTPPDFDNWIANEILLTRVVTNSLADLVNVIPNSETRLRDEGILPLYSFLRNLIDILKAGALGRGADVPDVPDTLADWREEVSIDYKALSVQFGPHLPQPVRAAVDWTFGLRDRDPRPHWTSEVAANSVAVDSWIQMLAGVGKEVEGTGWEQYLAQMTSDEIKRIAGVIREETLRARDQQGSGWDEEEAKKLSIELVENTKALLGVLP